MASLMQDFLESRRLANRTRKFIFPSVVLFLVAAVSAAGFYFYQKSGKPKNVAVGSHVAGVTTTVAQHHLSKDFLEKYFQTDDENDSKVGGVDGDPDHDFLSNYQEEKYKTDPTKPDTNGNGNMDGIDVMLGHDPAGTGDLLASESTTEYVKNVISSNSEYAGLSQDEVQKQVEGLFQPDRSIVMDFPKDSELTITQNNDTQGFEEYYNNIQSLVLGDNTELAQLQNGDLLSITPDELNQLIQKMDTRIALVMKTPVPSQVLNAHRATVAQLRAAKKIFEIVRDEYQNGNPSDQFWQDLFAQTVIVQDTDLLATATWQQIAKDLQAKGGF